MRKYFVLNSALVQIRPRNKFSSELLSSDQRNYEFDS